MAQQTQSKPQTAISPTREENYPEWYQQVIRAADLAEPSPVRGCMVIKPWGFALWERMQRVLDGMFKSTGHKNAYFPLFIPLSFLEREAKHVEGFAKECAVVTHHRLIPVKEGGLEAHPTRLVPDPEAKLEEPLIVRPTSETIIGEMFARWIESYRDLPLLINQWCNVVRWEMRTRMFLRTTEFLWQEGHTAHATADEAHEETMRMLNIYAQFAEDYLAMPVWKGEKSERERFPGAVRTYSIEAMMQDRRALQAGTSHFLGQNFSKAANIQFQTEKGGLEFCWTTSWGVSTRMIGGLIMTHGDDDGLVLPPRIAPTQIVILPIFHSAKNEEQVRNYCQKVADDLRSTNYYGRRVQVEIDDRDIRGGDKVWSWIKKGVPLRIEIGERDMQKDALFVGRRDRGHKEKDSVPRAKFVENLTKTLDEIQANIFDRAAKFREANSRRIDSKDAFYDYFRDESSSGFALVHWSGDSGIEAQIQNDLGVTLRCIPLNSQEVEEEGKCPFTGKASERRVVWARAY